MHYNSLNEDVMDVRMIAEDWREIQDDHEYDVEAALDHERASVPANARFPRLYLAQEQDAALTALGEPDDAEYRELAEQLGCEDADSLEAYGDNYEPTLIAETYFETYAEELAEDVGAITRDANWPNNHIDWEEAADALKQDYTSVEIGAATYYTHS